MLGIWGNMLTIWKDVVARPNFTTFREKEEKMKKKEKKTRIYSKFCLSYFIEDGYIFLF